MKTMKDNEQKNNERYIISMTGAAIFMATAYYLPAETFLAFILVILLVIPVSFLAYVIYATAKKIRRVESMTKNTKG